MKARLGRAVAAIEPDMQNHLVDMQMLHFFGNRRRVPIHQSLAADCRRIATGGSAQPRAVDARTSGR
jgi:hypothetical protein